jgi:hypothetical protein
MSTLKPRHRRIIGASATLAFCGASLIAGPTTLIAAPAPKRATAAQTSRRAPQPDDIQKVFVLKNVKAESLAFVLSVFPATISSVQVGSQMIGVSAAPQVMAAIEETIQRLEDGAATPPAPRARSVELTAYVLEALTVAAPGMSVPPQIEAIVAQMKNTYPYAGYRLADTLIARATADGVASFAIDAVSEAGLSPYGKVTYNLSAQNATVSAVDGRDVVRLSKLRFRAKIPGTDTASSRVEVEANIDVGDGQQVIVGKSGTGQTGNALILVLAAKIVD